ELLESHIGSEGYCEDGRESDVSHPTLRLWASTVRPTWLRTSSPIGERHLGGCGGSGNAGRWRVAGEVPQRRGGWLMDGGHAGAAQRAADREKQAQEVQMLHIAIRDLDVALGNRLPFHAPAMWRRAVFRLRIFRMLGARRVEFGSAASLPSDLKDKRRKLQQQKHKLQVVLNGRRAQRDELLTRVSILETAEEALRGVLEEGDEAACGWLSLHELRDSSHALSEEYLKVWHAKVGAMEVAAEREVARMVGTVRELWRSVHPDTENEDPAGVVGIPLGAALLQTHHAWETLQKQMTALVVSEVRRLRELWAFLEIAPEPSEETKLEEMLMCADSEALQWLKLESMTLNRCRNVIEAKALTPEPDDELDKDTQRDVLNLMSLVDTLQVMETTKTEITRVLAQHIAVQSGPKLQRETDMMLIRSQARREVRDVVKRDQEKKKVELAKRAEEAESGRIKERVAQMTEAAVAAKKAQVSAKIMLLENEQKQAQEAKRRAVEEVMSWDKQEAEKRAQCAETMRQLDELSGKLAAQQAEYAGTSQQLESLLRLKAEAEAKREEDSEAHKTRLMEDYEALEADLVRNIDRRSVLHQAVRAKQLDVVKKVLRKARVDVNSVDQDGLTSLQAAMGAQSWECAEYLIQRGATLNQSMPDGRTLLQHAMMKGGWDLAASMIRRGAHPDMPTTDPRQPLEYAAEHGGNGAFVDAIVGCLGIRIVTDFTDPTGKTVLHISAFKGNTEFLSSSLALLEPGDIATLVNKQDKTRKTALHEAARANSVEYVRMLLEAGADHRLRDMGGMTAYTMSAGGGKTRALLESWSKAKAPQ
ncbi:hypothetical protein CYMTET_29426, partial [Cymbomonas tetramitiformis]